MKKLENFKFVQGNNFFLVVGKEVRMFKGHVNDYVGSEDGSYINCCYLTHKNDKQLSGLIR
jgi:hypothetical protein